MTNATERAPDRLTPGQEYVRNLTTKLSVAQVKDIGADAVEAQSVLQRIYAEQGHEILGYELVVRVFIRAGGVTGDQEDNG